MRSKLLALVALAGALATPGRAQASPPTDFLEFQGHGVFNKDGVNHQLSAEVDFKCNGTNLEVYLRNVSPFTVEHPEQVLTGVFFNVNGNPALLTPISAKIGPVDNGATNSVVHPPAAHPFYPDVGGEWGFRNNIGDRSGDHVLFDTEPVDRQYGIGAAGFGLFDPADRFKLNQNLSGPTESKSLAGIDWGITSASDGPSGNGPAGTDPLIKYNAVFKLAGLACDDPLSITEVRFQYGSDVGETHFNGSLVPEPGTLSILGLAVAPLLARRLRRRRSS